MQQLVFNKEDKTYYYVVSKDDLNVRCDHCSQTIELSEFVFIHKSYSKKKFVKSYYCRGCIKHHKDNIVDEFIIAEIKNYIPDNCVLISDRPVTLTPSSTATVFSAAISNEGIQSDCSNVKVIDHTRLAGRHEATIEGAAIGIIPKEPKNNLNVDDIDGFLLDLKDSEIVTKEKRKLLKCKGGGFS